MSQYRITVTNISNHEAINHMDFDNKEDAEHYAKNHSLDDINHRYDVQKNNHGEFFTIKGYQRGQVV